MKKEVALKTPDGHRIRNRLIQRSGDNLVILAHGIATEKNEAGIFSKFAERTLDDSFDSIRFDFRGHGQSSIRSVEATITGEVLDLMTVITWSKSQRYEKVHVVAASFGASITLLASMAFDLSMIRSFVFWNPVINYRNTFIQSTVEWGREFFDHESINELARRPYTRIPETKFKIGPRMTVEFLLMHPENAAYNMKAPFLVLHGERDSMVPKEDAHDFCVRAQRPEAYREIPGVDHGFENAIDQVYSITSSWLRSQQAKTS